MTIQVYEPQITVTLYKMVSRKQGVAQRYAGAQRTVDLTPYLSDSGSVQTYRSLAEPVGTFNITFVDQPIPTIQDSAYALIEPMDMIEIRMARNAALYAGGKLPINMRGFVTRIRRVETIGDDGAPQRQVVITGENFGKLWQIFSVFWQVAYTQDVPLLTLYQVNAYLGMKIAFESASAFVTDMVENVMNPKVAQLGSFANRQILPFSAVCTVNQGQVTPAAMATMTEGSFWSILTTFMDSPWNELFIQDVESGPQVVFRPAPFKDINGKLLNGAADPGAVLVDIADVISLDGSRTDEQVANFFWVDPNTSSLDTDAIVTAANIVDGDLLDFNYPNNNPALYGYRKMQGQTMLMPDSATTPISELPPGEQISASGGFIEWWQLRALQLKGMNRDNSVLEEGGCTVKGNENIAPGKYLQIRRGGITSEAYVVSVRHNFVPFNSYTCDVQFERGNGFLKRDQYTASPYWGEGRAGPYDRTPALPAPTASTGSTGAQS